MQRRTHAVLCLCLLVLVPIARTTLGCEAPVASVPSILSDARFPAPWVAADVAVRPDGSLRSDLLKEHSRTLLRQAAVESERRREADKAGLSINPNAAKAGTEVESTCHSFMVSSPGARLPITSAEQLLDETATIVRGRVLAIREGFFHGSPGSLLQLRAEYLRGAPADETYLFYPLASIKVGDSRVCAKPLGEYVQPRVGDEVFIFDTAPKPMVLEGKTVLWVRTTDGLVHFSQGGKVILPRPLKDLAADDEKVIRGRILSLISRSSIEAERQ